MNKFPQQAGPIGVFDSGYGGLTILHGIRQLLPQYDYLYLGDNARAPYGPRSFEVVYQFTRQAVIKLFEQGCHLIIIGCNTASAKALRSIQQRDLPSLDAKRRVLGIIRPTAETIGSLTATRHVGILATEGTIKSDSYRLEIQKLFPDIQVQGMACPLWAAIVEANEADRLLRQEANRRPYAYRPADRRHRIGLHPLSPTDEQHRETCAIRRSHRATRRICGQQLAAISATPPRDRRALHQARNGSLSHHREQRQVQGECADIPTRANRLPTRKLGIVRTSP